MYCLLRVKEQVSPAWEEYLYGLHINLDKITGETLISGQLPDQSALYGVLLQIHNLGLTLVALETRSTT